MVDLSVLLFICIALPIAMMLFVFRGQARILMGFLLFGLTACLLSAYLNTAAWHLLDSTKFYITVNVSPIIEELAKMLPILIFAFCFHPNRKNLIEAAVCCGLGFAILENALIVAQNAASVSLLTALLRGIGAGMMHSLCTGAVACGLSLMAEKRKWFLTGTVALSVTAMTYHSLYNILVQSEFPFLGVVLTVGTFAVVLLGGVILPKQKKNGD